MDKQNRLESMKAQINDALREAKIEDLAGCLMSLHQVQNYMVDGIIPESEAMEEAKDITRKAVELQQDLKELTSDTADKNDMLEKGDLSWLADISEDDWDMI